MSDLVQVAFRISPEALAKFDQVLTKTGATRSVIIRAAVDRCNERDDTTWLLEPSKTEVHNDERPK